MNSQFYSWDELENLKEKIIKKGFSFVLVKKLIKCVQVIIAVRIYCLDSQIFKLPQSGIISAINSLKIDSAICI